MVGDTLLRGQDGSSHCPVCKGKVGLNSVRRTCKHAYLNIGADAHITQLHAQCAVHGRCRARCPAAEWSMCCAAWWPVCWQSLALWRSTACVPPYNHPPPLPLLCCAGRAAMRALSRDGPLGALDAGPGHMQHLKGSSTSRQHTAPWRHVTTLEYGGSRREQAHTCSHLLHGRGWPAAA